MADVFISYKAERRRAARHLANVLQAYGYSVWYDYGLTPGEDFAPRLMRELESAKAVVVLWCALSVDSDWVAKEANAARGGGTYLPCWIERAQLPGAFAEADTIDLTPWDANPRSHVLDRLIAEIGRRVGRAPQADFNALMKLDEDWRGFGAPSLAQFALDAAPEAMRESAHPAPARVAQPVAAVAPTAPPSRASSGERWEQAHAFQATPGEVQTAIWSPDGRLIAAEGVDSSLVTVWDPHEGRAVCSYAGPSNDARPGCLAFSYDSQILAAGYGASVYAFNPHTGANAFVLKDHGANVCAIGFAASSDALATANLNQRIVYWSVRDQKLIAEFKASGWGAVQGLTLRGTGKLRWIQVDFDTLEIGNWRAMNIERDAFEPFGERGAEAEWPIAANRSLHARDYNTALELNDTAHGRAIERWSTDRFKLASLRTEHLAGRFMMVVDGAKLKVWSAEDGRELATLAPENGAWIRTAEFSPDGAMIATGDSKGAVRVWRRA